MFTASVRQSLRRCGGWFLPDRLCFEDKNLYFRLKWYKLIVKMAWQWLKK